LDDVRRELGLARLDALLLERSEALAEGDELVGVVDRVVRLERLVRLALDELLDETLTTLLRAAVDLGARLRAAAEERIELPRHAALLDGFCATASTGASGCLSSLGHFYLLGICRASSVTEARCPMANL